MNASLILLGRILLSVIFLISGYGKLVGAEGFAGYLGSLGLSFGGYLASSGYSEPLVMAYAVAVCELVGAVALILGFQTRIVSVLFALFCIATAVLAHMDYARLAFVDQDQMIAFLKNLAIAGGFFVLAGSGPGAYSVDGQSATQRTSDYR